MDERAERFEAMRPRLFGIAYRMLQTREDAEEAVQEAWLRLARSESVDSVEGFLLRTTTRLCLDREKSASRRRETYAGPWLADLVDTRSSPEQEADRLQSLNLGLLHVLLTLPPLERAVFLLREAFDYPYDEIAPVVGRRPDACRQLARRARNRVRSQGATLSVDPKQHEALLHAFLQASQEGELQRLESILANDVVLVSDGGGRVVAATRPIQGASNVSRFLVGIARKAGGEVSAEVSTVNGAPAAVIRIDGVVSAVFSLQVEGGRVRRIFVVRNPEKLRGVARAGADPDAGAS